jgi:RNA polymerase II subunit A small phosphatase-like protein
MVTQVPQGALNPVPVMQNSSPKQRSKTQGTKFPPGSSRPRVGKQNFGMLGPQPEHNKGWKTLVLDLDETLVHSQFNQIKNPDYIIPVNIDGNVCNIYVQKRPGVDNFLKVMSQYFELVIFTASLSKYADPLMNKMDPNGYCTMRLFREHCTYMNGVFTKDMSKIGRN